MTNHLPIRVVGIGSPNGDDAVGWEVVRRLRGNMAHTLAVQFHEIDGGQRLLELLDGKGTLYVIDAYLSDDDTATTVRLEWPAPLEFMPTGTTHDLRLAQALELAAALELLPPRVVLFGVKANSLRPGGEVSSTVAAAADTVTLQLLCELSHIQKDATKR